MNDYSDSTDRTPREITIFALGFVGFGMAGGGIILGSPALAITGAIILMLAVWSFGSSSRN